MSKAASPELALVAACCRWPRSPARNAAVQQAADAAIDWPRFERVIDRHRVAGLVRDGMQQAQIDAPADVDRRIAAKAMEAARVALDMARESLQLQRTFDDAGIPAVFVKGSALALLAFGELGIKQSWDIDLVTPPERAMEGRRLLEQLGYVLLVPQGLSDVQFERFVAPGKEAVFRHAETGIYVELHWRLIDNDALLGGIDLSRATQSIALGGASLTTLNDEALFAYLCVHGTMHGWSRLKWIADVAAFLSRRDDRDIQRLYDAAHALGAGKAPAATLLLCERLFDTDLPASLRAGLDRDGIAKGLAAHAHSCLDHGRGEAEVDRYSLPGLRTEASQLFIGGTPRYFLGELRRKWVSQIDRAIVILPERLTFLYHFLRLPLWLSRQFRQAVRRPG